MMMNNSKFADTPHRNEIRKIRDNFLKQITHSRKSVFLHMFRGFWCKFNCNFNWMYRSQVLIYLWTWCICSSSSSDFVGCIFQKILVSFYEYLCKLFFISVNKFRRKPSKCGATLWAPGKFYNYFILEV